MGGREGGSGVVVGDVKEAHGYAFRKGAMVEVSNNCLGLAGGFGGWPAGCGVTGPASGGSQSGQRSARASRLLGVARRSIGPWHRRHMSDDSFQMPPVYSMRRICSSVIGVP